MVNGHRRYEKTPLPLRRKGAVILSVGVSQSLEFRQGPLDHLGLDTVGDAHMPGAPKPEPGDQQQVELLGPLAESQIIGSRDRGKR